MTCMSSFGFFARQWFRKPEPSSRKASEHHPGQKMELYLSNGLKPPPTVDIVVILQLIFVVRILEYCHMGPDPDTEPVRFILVNKRPQMQTHLFHPACEKVLDFSMNTLSISSRCL